MYVRGRSTPLARSQVLLGEAGKVTSVSAYRFASVAAGAAGQGITVQLRGKAGEAVPLLFAAPSAGAGFTCKLVAAAIGADGSGTATFGH
jgi:hypothetical protein